MIQVQFGTKVLRTPSSTRLGFDRTHDLQIMTVHFISLRHILAHTYLHKRLRKIKLTRGNHQGIIAHFVSWEVKESNCHFFKYIDRPFCLQTDFYLWSGDVQAQKRVSCIGIGPT